MIKKSRHNYLVCYIGQNQDNTIVNGYLTFSTIATRYINLDNCIDYIKKANNFKNLVITCVSRVKNKGSRKA